MGQAWLLPQQNCKGWQLQGEEGGSAKQQPQLPLPGPPFPARLDLPCVGSWFGSCTQSWGYWVPCQEATMGWRKGWQDQKWGKGCKSYFEFQFYHLLIHQP